MYTGKLFVWEVDLAGTGRSVEYEKRVEAFASNELAGQWGEGTLSLPCQSWWRSEAPWRYTITMTFLPWNVYAMYTHRLMQPNSAFKISPIQSTQHLLLLLYCLTVTNGNLEKWDWSGVGREMIVTIFENSRLWMRIFF